MKKTLAYMGGFIMAMLTLSLQAQENWDAKKNPTVDSIAALYRDKIVPAPVPPAREDIFPVFGRFDLTSGNSSVSVTITADEENKGIAWVDGLPQGRIKALLRKSPATYKIPAQTTTAGQSVPEGTLLYEKSSNTLRICLGKAYNASAPEIVFETPEVAPVTTGTGKSNNHKEKTPKTVVYTGSKQLPETVKN